MFIEDESVSKEPASEILSAPGYEVLEARDGEEGLRLYEEFARSSSLVVTDMDLPGCDGEEVCWRVRKLNGSVPILVTFGFLAPERRIRLLDLGVQEIILKPFRIEDFLGRVSSDAVKGKLVDQSKGDGNNADGKHSRRVEPSRGKPSKLLSRERYASNRFASQPMSCEERSAEGHEYEWRNTSHQKLLICK